MKAAPLHESNVHSHSHYLNGIIFLCFPITESKLAHISQSLVQEKSKKNVVLLFRLRYEAYI
jgi:hypothetical protein